MISDSERREVARRLRELPDDSTYTDLIGVISDRDGWYAAAEAADRLADLIEPGEPKAKCVAEVKVDGERLEKLVHDAAAELTGIDRDALLELARICEDTGYMYAKVCVESTDGAFSDLTRRMARIEWKTARAIREALGVER